MLPHAFIDWWFAPWNGQPNVLPATADLIGRRDGYRLWCAHAGIRPDLPPRMDAGWVAAAGSTGAQLVDAARLFAGMGAARQHDMQLLNALRLEERKWCLSRASTQPLHVARGIPYRPDDAPEVRGLVELAMHLEHGFAGLWSRLRLSLPQAIADRVGELAQSAPDEHAVYERAAARAQRCWKMCSDHCAHAAAN